MIIFLKDKEYHVDTKQYLSQLEKVKKFLITAVTMTTVTFQCSGYLRFNVIQVENIFSDPPFLFCKIISNWILNHKKMLAKN